MSDQAVPPTPFRQQISTILANPEAVRNDYGAAVAWVVLMGGPEQMIRAINALTDLRTLRSSDPAFALGPRDIDAAVDRLSQHRGIAEDAVTRINAEVGRAVWSKGTLKIPMPGPGENLTWLSHLVWIWCDDQEIEAHLIGNTADLRKRCARSIEPWASDADIDPASKGPIWGAVESYKRLGRRYSGGR